MMDDDDEKKNKKMKMKILHVVGDGLGTLIGVRIAQTNKSDRSYDQQFFCLELNGMVTNRFVRV